MEQNEFEKCRISNKDALDLLIRCRYFLAELVCRMPSTIVGEKSLIDAMKLYDRLSDPLDQLFKQL